MPDCAVKRGFFSLRDCGKPAVDVCNVCGRWVCKEHNALIERRLICVECEAKESEEKNHLKETGRGGWFGRSRPYRYRDRYYSKSHYRPFYLGAIYDHYYDDYDVRAFDEELAEVDEMVDDQAPDFGDS